MSLKAVHIFFIACCILLSFLVGAWGLQQYRLQGSGIGLALAVIFYTSGLVLVVYGMRFVQKMKELGI